MLDILKVSGHPQTRAALSAWMKKEDHEDFLPMPDADLAAFLNGLIIKRRGAREGGPPPVEPRLSHNAVLVKLKIAMGYKAEDMLALVEKAGLILGKSELSAFFRKPDHKHYRECKDQVLRRFLMGLQLTLRGDGSEPEDLG